MFTGLVEEIGRIQGISRKKGYQILTIQANKVLDGTAVGDSIGVNGVCQTVTALDVHSSKTFQVETLAESLEKTTLGGLRVGNSVHLERAAALGQRMGGHLVQGHVEGVGQISKIDKAREQWYVTVDLPGVLADRCISEGSIALDGVSLTIARKIGHKVTVNLIPETLNSTLWKMRKVGDSINVETDVLGRYAEQTFQKTTQKSKHKSKLTAEQLAAWGYSV